MARDRAGAPDIDAGALRRRLDAGLMDMGLDLDETPVSTVESTHLKWATPDSMVGEVVGEMMNNYVRHVLVGDDAELVGMVHMRDMLAAYLP